MNRTCLLLLAGLISSPAAAAEVREAVRQDWAFQHRLAVDTDRAGNLVLKRQRQPAPLLDEQAGTLKDDRDPTDQVARRTDALVAHLAKTWPGQADWEGFRRRLDPLLAEAKAGQPDLTGKDPARQKTYTALCALRRAIAFANPLLDFDDIDCMKPIPLEAWPRPPVIPDLVRDGEAVDPRYPDFDPGNFLATEGKPVPADVPPRAAAASVAEGARAAPGSAADGTDRRKESVP